MEQFSLRQFQDGDLPMFKSWLHQPHVKKWYVQPADWVYEIQNRTEEFAFVHHFIALKDGVPFGFCQYYEYRRGGENWHGSIDVDGTYSIDYLIGNPENLGKGYGRMIVRLLIDEIWKISGARRVIVQPEPDNTASCSTLLSCGFKHDVENKLYIIERVRSDSA